MPESALTPRRNCWLVRLSEASVIGESPVTITRNVVLLLRGGEPSSVTRTVMRLVLGPWASVGVQVNTPVLGWRFTPVGAATKLKLRALARMFVSVAVFVTTSVVSSLMD